MIRLQSTTLQLAQKDVLDLFQELEERSLQQKKLNNNYFSDTITHNNINIDNVQTNNSNDRVKLNSAADTSSLLSFTSPSANRFLYFNTTKNNSTHNSAKD
ncbi:uncharacterized protein SCDLUD_002453 [Saccharomycodes ludwigii]|uniref:uncharacterized protein n=1 Tax=Saccharomycodes ludwigii TaxID=36035 RepID=UPI001E892ABE|nr:hypothetical protein SCDLUD_002453 [Saccharomycodes ludwigii]KAH3900988.1 hypothetical protein SCDLUD_002453 [Saccharomycodes ludwigii]